MRLIHLLPLVPFALAAPTAPTPELSASQWNSIQSSFVDGVRSLGSWSWTKAEDLINEIESEGNAKDESDLTIWQQLQADPNSFSKLVKVIKFEEKSIKYLDNKDAQITFFAPNNDALHDPRHDDDDHDHDDFVGLMANPSLATLSSILDKTPSLLEEDKDDDDEKKKRRKEIFKKIAGKVLQYHGLPKAYTASELAQNSTLETALKAGDGSFGGLNRRIRIVKTFVPPSLKINFYAKVLVSDKKARNGYLHTLNHPLIPPGSILEEVFLFPDTFSTLTSSVQKVHGSKYLDWSYDHDESKPGKPKFKGAPLVTLFAPTNVAFGLLPPKLKFYLFSPFGEKALTKVLMYHAIPETLLLSELLYTEKKGKVEVENFNIADDPSFHKEFSVGTALPNTTLKIVVDKSRFLPIEGAVKTTITVNDIPVNTIDVPARNGASHIIDKILVPPHKHHHSHGEDFASLDSWDNWEEWLPLWADEE
ncbi:hypothetical protein P7C73_g2099, partial [Tremellales sp. Uapishka_1]